MLWATPKKRHPQHIVTHNIYDEQVLSTTYLHNICTVSTTYRHPQDMHSTTYACTPQHTSTTYKTLSTTCSVMDTRTTYLRLFWISCGGHFGAIFIGCGAHLICCGEQAVYVVDNTLGICCGWHVVDNIKNICCGEHVCNPQHIEVVLHNIYNVLHNMSPTRDTYILWTTRCILWRTCCGPQRYP